MVCFAILRANTVACAQYYQDNYVLSSAKCQPNETYIPTMQFLLMRENFEHFTAIALAPG